MQLREIMKRDVFSVSPDSEVIEAARKMEEHNVGCLLVMKDGVVKGILTDRDIVLKVVARRADPARTKVSDIMQSHVVSAAPDTDLLEATRLMASHHVRRLPVREDGRVVGIVSMTDLGRVVQEEVNNLFSLRAIPVHH